jgi:hypothetical protein
MKRTDASLPEVSPGSHRRPRAISAFGISVLALAALGLPACGGSDDGLGALEPYAGLWQLEAAPAPVQQLTCPSDMTDGPFPLWVELSIEPGAITDLVELASPCVFHYQVAGKTANLVNPDPFTMMAPSCLLGFTDIEDTLDIVPNVTSWALTLQDPLSQGGPPRMVLSGTAAVTISPFDPTTGAPLPTVACNYNVNSTFAKVTRH